LLADLKDGPHQVLIGAHAAGYTVHDDPDAPFRHESPLQE
jgi:hypothetical protein